jgi:RNA polymerase sigma factor (sigma-70 family)
MADRKPYLLWPGADERVVVGEMLKNPEARQWYECSEFVRRTVEMKARNIPEDQREDIVQKVMIRIHHYLPHFQFRCSLRTWLFDIIQSCIADAYRQLKHTGEHMTSLGDSSEDTEHEDGILTLHTTLTVEDEYMVRDELEKALAALEEYISTHAHPARNRQILHMVLFEGHMLQEAARAAGCSAAMASYVLHSAQRYVREKLGHQHAPD